MKLNHLKFKTNLSIIRRLKLTMALYLCALLFIGILAFIAVFSVSVMRSYVGAESMWSKARGTASFNLQRYLRTNNIVFYENFQTNLDIIEGIILTLSELRSGSGNISKAAEGLIRGGNMPEEVHSMVVFMTFSRDFPYIKDALDAWYAEAKLIVEFKEIGLEIFSKLKSKKMRAIDYSKYEDKLVVLTYEMQGLEINFSDNIRLASRKMAFIGFILVGMATLLLGLIGGRFQYSIIRNISLGITELIEVTNKISNDQLDFKILYSVKDEIGTLAQAFMEMGQRLKGAKSQIVKAELNLDKSEKKLSESSQAFNELMSALSHSAIISKTDIEGRMNYINKKYIDISGYLETELIGQNHKLLSSGKHNPDFFKELWATILDSKVWQGTICNKKKDGSFYWLSTTIIPSLLDNKIIGFLSICSDVTAEVNAKNQLAHSARLSALGEMAGGIAHEINTPLGALRMMVERVIRLNQKGQVDSENSIADGQKMLKVVDRMAVIVNGMRRLSRSGENDNFVKVSAQQFVEDALGLCQEKFKNYGIDIRTKMSANFEILCRSVEISQVIINLLNNSFKALSKLEEKWIEIAFDANEQFALIRVTDSGKGLEAKVKERLMQPFFTTGEIGEGLGIGLNISYKIVQEHGGVLYYDDSVQNTCFVIKLPIRKPENISKASA